MHDVTLITKLAWADLVELLPWFFVAILIGATVDLLYLDIVARRSFRRHGLLGILFTTSIGAFSPFCSFTVIPLIRKLLRGGVPLSAVMAFWIASPAMDPPIFAMTAAQIGLPLAFARLLGALALSIGAGVLILALERRGMLQHVLRDERDDVREDLKSPAVPQLVAVGVPATVEGAGMIGSGDGTPSSVGTGGASVDAGCADSGACAATQQPEEDDNLAWWPAAKASLRSKRNWKITARNIARDSVNLGKWLVFACVFEAVIRVYVPNGVVTAVLGGRGLFAIPLAVLISVPLYLNGVGAIPIVGGLLLKGMAPGAAVSFLLAGAVTTIPAMVAVRSVVNNRVFALYLAIGTIGSALLGFLAQALLA